MIQRNALALPQDVQAPVPQTKSMNRGAWWKTEDLIDCYRDLVPIEVWGGPIWGNDPSDDYFVEPLARTSQGSRLW